MQNILIKCIVFFPLLILSLLVYGFNGTVPLFGEHQTERNLHFSYTNDSIPLYDYGDYGKQINPLFVAVEVIAHTRNPTPSDLGIALNNADWLVDNAVSFGNYSLLLEFDFPLSAYKVGPPWISAMAQARAALAMTLAYDITNDTKYLSSAERFLSPLFIDTHNIGGVTDKSSNNGWWYKEYVFSTKNEARPEPRVLNGMMAILKDLYRFYNATGDENGKYLFDKGVVALKEHINEYDINQQNLKKHFEKTNNANALTLLENRGLATIKNHTHTYQVNASDIEGYSFYDALGRLAGESYHKYHISLLSNLLNMTNNDPILKEYHNKWKAYQGPYLKIRLT